MGGARLAGEHLRCSHKPQKGANRAGYFLGRFQENNGNATKIQLQMTKHICLFKKISEMELFDGLGNYL